MWARCKRCNNVMIGVPDGYADYCYDCSLKVKNKKKKNCT